MLIDIANFLRSLPKRHVLSWIVWGVGAIVLLGTGLVLGAGENAGAVFRSLPRWHQVADIIWGALAVPLAGLGLLTRQQQVRDRFHKIEDQLDQLNTKFDLFIATGTSARVFMADYQMPTPRPEASIGWVGAVTDTLKAHSLAAVDGQKAKNVFVRVSEHGALVNAALDGRVTIKRVLLSSISRSGSSTPHSVRIDVTNNTAASMILIIPKGQVFENAIRRERVQNLVVADQCVITCAPNAISSTKVPAFCLNRDLKPPNEHSGNITPLKVKFEFTDQKDVWAAVKERTV